MPQNLHRWRDNAHPPVPRHIAHARSCGTPRATDGPQTRNQVHHLGAKNIQRPRRNGKAITSLALISETAIHHVQRHERPLSAPDHSQKSQPNFAPQQALPAELQQGVRHNLATADGRLLSYHYDAHAECLCNSSPSCGVCVGPRSGRHGPMRARLFGWISALWLVFGLQRLVAICVRFKRFQAAAHAKGP